MVNSLIELPRARMCIYASKKLDLRMITVEVAAINPNYMHDWTVPRCLII